MDNYQKQIKDLYRRHEALLSTVNTPWGEDNGIFRRYRNPVLTAAHIPLTWRYEHPS